MIKYRYAPYIGKIDLKLFVMYEVENILYDKERYV